MRRVAAERPGICRWWPIRGSWSWPVSAPAAPPAAPRSATCLCHGGEPHTPPTIAGADVFYLLLSYFVSFMFIRAIYSITGFVTFCVFYVFYSDPYDLTSILVLLHILHIVSNIFILHLTPANQSNFRLE